MPVSQHGQHGSTRPSSVPQTELVDIKFHMMTAQQRSCQARPTKGGRSVVSQAALCLSGLCLLSCHLAEDAAVHCVEAAGAVAVA